MANVFDQFDSPTSASVNPFDQFDTPTPKEKTVLDKVTQFLLGTGKFGGGVAYGGAIGIPKAIWESNKAVGEFVAHPIDSLRAIPQIPQKAGDFFTALNNLLPTPSEVPGQYDPQAYQKGQNLLTVGQTAAENPFETGQVVGELFSPSLYAQGARLTGKGLSVMRDRLSPDMNALRITREALGNDPNQIAAVIAANRAQPNALASEAAAALPTPLNAYQTLLRTGEQLNTAPGNASAVRAVQRQTHLDELARLAGGATQTEAEAAAAASRRGLNQVTTPMREEAFAEAAIPGQVFPVLERKAAEGRAAASGAVQDVRRFTAAIQSAEDWAREWTASGTTRAPGAVPRPPSRYTYPGQLAGKAEQVATNAAEESLQAGAKARAAENTLASMKSRGLEPLTAQPLMSGIESKLTNPEIALNAKTAPALRRVAQMAADWTDQNGYITPEALYAIRKHGVNAAIEDLMPGASESARKAAASKVMAEVRPIIDDLLGDKFKGYLTTFENNARAIDRQGLSAKLMDLYEKSPDEFVSIVKGNNPDAVENLMGFGERDIKEAMGDQFGRVQKIADDLVRDASIKKQAGQGGAALSGILARNELNAAIPNALSRKIMLANKIIGELEGRVNAKTMKVLINAAQSGASMNDLLMLTPPSERSKVLSALRNFPQNTNRLAPTAPSGVQQQ